MLCIILLLLVVVLAINTALKLQHGIYKNT
jgi:hypothetical protein